LITTWVFNWVLGNRRDTPISSEKKLPELNPGEKGVERRAYWKQDDRHVNSASKGKNKGEKRSQNNRKDLDGWETMV